MDATCDHGSLVVEAAQALHNSIISLTDEEGVQFVQRASSRAGGWEHRADQIVIATRSAAGRAAGSDALAGQLTTQDDAIDALEEAVFELTLLSREGAPLIRPILEPLASLAVLAAQEHLKALEIARLVLDDADRTTSKISCWRSTGSWSSSTTPTARTERLVPPSPSRLPTFA